MGGLAALRGVKPSFAPSSEFPSRPLPAGPSLVAVVFDAVDLTFNIPNHGGLDFASPF